MRIWLGYSYSTKSKITCKYFGFFSIKYINICLLIFIPFLPVPEIKLHEDNPNSVRVGELVTIRATVTGKPVTWMIDGKEVSSSEDINIKEDRDKHSITIKKRFLTPGVYTFTITAKNDLGDLDADPKEVRVTVKDGKYKTVIKGRPFDSGGGGLWFL